MFYACNLTPDDVYSPKIISLCVHFHLNAPLVDYLTHSQRVQLIFLNFIKNLYASTRSLSSK